MKGPSSSTSMRSPGGGGGGLRGFKSLPQLPDLCSAAPFIKVRYTIGRHPLVRATHTESNPLGGVHYIQTQVSDAELEKRVCVCVCVCVCAYGGGG